jgi:predicted flap endonuclease-1-like 5' DNA nuclease
MKMDTNTLIAVSVDGFLVIFFIYALLDVYRIAPSKAVKPLRPEVREVMKPRPEVREVVKPRPEVREVVKPRPEVREVVKPRPEVREVVKPRPEVREVVKPRSSQNLIDIEGIGSTNALKLRTIGIETTTDLLDACATQKGREELAKKTGASPRLILEWVNLAGLFSTKGVGEEYPDLLEEAMRTQ